MPPRTARPFTVAKSEAVISDTGVWSIGVWPDTINSHDYYGDALRMRVTLSSP